MKISKTAQIFSAIASAVQFSTAVEIRRHYQTAPDTKNFPVTRVVNILKQMQENLQNDSVKDEKMNKKMECWANDNIKQKTGEISDGEDSQKSLESAIEQGEANSAKLEAEIKELGENIEEKTQSLDEATSIRKKQLDSFNEEEKDLRENIAALKGALVVLKRHNGESVEEPISPEAREKAAQLIQKLLNKHAYMSGTATTTSAMQRRSKITTVLTELLNTDKNQQLRQAPEGGYWDAKATGSEDYNSQSGEIFGMLGQMKDDMEKDLVDARDLEATRLREFSELKASLEGEIAEATNSKESKTVQNQKTLDKLAVDRVSLRDTLKDLAANKEYLAMVKETQKRNSAQYAERVRATSEQLKAVNQAIQILSSDEARDLFSSHFNRKSSFIQTSKTNPIDASRIQEAISFLSTKGLSTTKLSMLALSKLDAFEKVLEAIDKMIVDLNKTNAAEIQKRDVCTAQLNENDKSMATETLVKEGHASDIEDLTTELEGVQETISKLNGEVGEIDVAIKSAGEERSEQNADFQDLVDEQVATVKILNQARQVLAKVYGTTPPGEEPQAFISDAPAPAASPEFKAYKKQDNSVLHLLQSIIVESENLKTAAITAEQTSQTAYEKFVIASNKNRDGKQESIADQTEKKGEIEQSLVQSNTFHANSLKTLADLVQTGKDLHTNCDFVLKNFEITQEARASEIDALKQAKAILSGAK